MKKQILEKLFFKIGEVAEITGLEPYVLRYWEGEFSFKLTKSKNNQRLYQRKDIDQIQKIKTLLYDEKFTIAGAKKRLREIKRKPDGDQLSLVLPQSDGNSRKMKEVLQELRRELKSFIHELEAGA